MLRTSEAQRTGQSSVIGIRLATLQDTAAICAIHRSDVRIWERYDATGQPYPVTYDDLTLYERWLHGGPWLSVETCAVHLNRLLAGTGFPLVATLEGQVLAAAEVYENVEAAPYGHHLSIGVLYTHGDHTSLGLGGALVSYIAEMGRLMNCQRLTVGDPDAPDFYAGQRFQKIRSGKRVRVPTQAGRAFFQAADLIDRNPEQIRGWHMALGRYGGPRQEWAMLFPGDWAAGMPEIINVPMAHLKISAAGQNAIVYLKEANDADSRPGECSVVCWSTRPLSAPLLTAIRDRAHREGFHTIVTYADETDWPVLAAADARTTDHRQDVYALELKP